jgi:asparagine synthase (glutamine-hydrolysing)
MVSTRLAIIDLAGGDQPLSDERGRYWVVQNGEIYNYVELREELVGLGHAFSTGSDTEVIAHAFAEWGPACLPRLNGDFALAVWDRVKRELFLARDRFGARPLYLATYGNDLCFASECKALLRHPGARRALDPSGLVDSFTLWSILPDRSAFEGIRELAPGHYLLAGEQGIEEERRWWELDFAPADQVAASEDDLVEELRELLLDATRIRLRADVPVAAYVSGGLDSSAIAAMTRMLSSEQLYSFGISFADDRFDEASYQATIAKELGTSLTQVRVTAADIAALMPRVVELWEKPTLRTAPAPLLSLSAAVREAGLKVVLTGEAADELFAGYDVFREDKVRRFWAREPSSQLRPLLFARLNAFIGRDLTRTGSLLGSFYGRGLTETGDPLYSHRIRFTNTARCARLFAADVVARAASAGDPLERLEARLPAGFTAFGPLGKAQHLEIETFLNGYLLHAQGDRMLMGNSVEGRFPFLDYRVAEFAARLPERMRLRGLEEKHALRRAVARWLPEEVWARRKVPYRAPIAEVFAGEQAPEYVRELLSAPALERAGIFEPGAVARLRDKFEAAPGRVGETDEMALVGVVSTMLLHDRLVARPSLAEPLEPTRLVMGDQVIPSLEGIAA